MRTKNKPRIRIILSLLLLSLLFLASPINTQAKTDKKTLQLMSIEITKSGIKITWNKVKGLEKINVYRLVTNVYDTTTSLPLYWTTTKSNVTSFTDKKVTTNKIYEYGITAYGKNGTVYDPPTILRYMFLKAPKAKKIENRTEGIYLQWGKSKDCHGYNIYRMKPGDKVYYYLNWVDNKTTSYIDKNVTPGTYYRYVITSFRDENWLSKEIDSPISKELAITRWQRTAPTPTPTPAPSTKSTYRALCVAGVNYVREQNLPECKEDGIIMRNMLRGMNYQTVTLFNDLTANQIKAQIADKLSSAKSNDVSLFYFSGHGNRDGLGCANDTFLYFSDLAAALNKLKGKVIVILDACESGGSITKSISEDAGDNTFAQNAIAAFRSVERPEASIAMGELRTSKFYVLASSAYYQSSYTYYSQTETGSYFTAGLVQGEGYRHGKTSWSGLLPADKNSDRKISLEEAYTYSRSRVNLFNADPKTPQDVQRYPINSSFTLFYK